MTANMRYADPTRYVPKGHVTRGKTVVVAFMVVMVQRVANEYGCKYFGGKAAGKGEGVS